MSGSQPYVGQLALVPYTFAPNGWMDCAGQLLPISEYDTLFNLIGTTYGGDGQSTFALPDLRGRSIIHQGTGPGLSSYVIGQNGGVEQVTLTVNQIPLHTHVSNCSANAQGSNDAAGGVLAVTATGKNQFATNAGNATMGSMVGTSGGSQPHDNHQPYLVLRWIISLFGIYPSQS